MLSSSFWKNACLTIPPGLLKLSYCFSFYFITMHNDSFFSLLISNVYFCRCYVCSFTDIRNCFHVISSQMRTYSSKILHCQIQVLYQNILENWLISLTCFIQKQCHLYFPSLIRFTFCKFFYHVFKLMSQRFQRF